MRQMLDTHLLLSAVGRSRDLSGSAKSLIDDPENTVVFSAVSIWEVAIKYSLKRPDFRTDPRMLRHTLLAHRYSELAMTGEHAMAVSDLPLLHKDPFDRLLIAQCMIEGITLLTADQTIARYPGPIQRV
jgi:PIN domain nuclease of toxin-antitoxin system